MRPNKAVDTHSNTKTMAAQATYSGSTKGITFITLNLMRLSSSDAKHQQQTTRVKWVPGNISCLLVCRAPIDTKHRCTLEQNGAKGNFLISCLLVCLTDAIYVDTLSSKMGGSSCCLLVWPTDAMLYVNALSRDLPAARLVCSLASKCGGHVHLAFSSY